MRRIYQAVLEEHFANYDQIAFLSGPRQVGKSTTAQLLSDQYEYSRYLNWDDTASRELILAGFDEMLRDLPVDAAREQQPLLMLDEIHKYSDWKNFLKGFVDRYKANLDILVTSSAKLDIYRHGGDSMMGRYFLYHLHPLSVAELLRTDFRELEFIHPAPIENDLFQALFDFGGFPEPFTKQERRFYNRWQGLRFNQLFREDIRELSQVQELGQLQLLAQLIQQQAASLVEFKSFSKKIRVSDQTIRRWIEVLESFYFCFAIRPWSRNLTRSLLKKPKIFLWDWSVIEDKGAKVENFVASHLLKAVDFWTDIGLGQYGLYFVRDKDQREVDFLVTKNDEPWLLLEVKSSMKEPLSKHLLGFQAHLNAEHVLQLAFDMPYTDMDCFSLGKPAIVSLKTFLSQLV